MIEIIKIGITQYLFNCLLFSFFEFLKYIINIILDIKK